MSYSSDQKNNDTNLILNALIQHGYNLQPAYRYLLDRYNDPLVTNKLTPVALQALQSTQSLSSLLGSLGIAAAPGLTPSYFNLASQLGPSTSIPSTEVVSLLASVTSALKATDSDLATSAEQHFNLALTMTQDYTNVLPNTAVSIEMGSWFNQVDTEFNQGTYSIRHFKNVDIAAKKAVEMQAEVLSSGSIKLTQEFKWTSDTGEVHTLSLQREITKGVVVDGNFSLRRESTDKSGMSDSLHYVKDGYVIENKQSFADGTSTKRTISTKTETNADGTKRQVIVFDQGVYDKDNKLAGQVDLKTAVIDSQGQHIITGASAVGAMFGSQMGYAFSQSHQFSQSAEKAGSYFITQAGKSFGRIVGKMAAGQAIDIGAVLKDAFDNFSLGNSLGDVFYELLVANGATANDPEITRDYVRSIVNGALGNGDKSWYENLTKKAADKASELLLDKFLEVVDINAIDAASANKIKEELLSRLKNAMRAATDPNGDIAKTNVGAFFAAAFVESELGNAGIITGVSNINQLANIMQGLVDTGPTEAWYASVGAYGEDVVSRFLTDKIFNNVLGWFDLEGNSQFSAELKDKFYQKFFSATNNMVLEGLQKLGISDEGAKDANGNPLNLQGTTFDVISEWGSAYLAEELFNSANNNTFSAELRVQILSKTQQDLKTFLRNSLDVVFNDGVYSNWTSDLKVIGWDVAAAYVAGEVVERWGIDLDPVQAKLVSTAAVDAAKAAIGSSAARAGEFKKVGVNLAAGFLVAEGLDALGVHGFAAQLAQPVLTQIVTNIATSGSLSTWNSGVDWASLGSAVGAYVGVRLAQQVYQPKTTEGQIGAQIGALVGATYGAEIGGAVGGWYGALWGALIGAFVGYIIGGGFGDLFGTEKVPRSYADIVYDHGNDRFLVTNVYKKDDGDADAARQFAQNAADLLNNVVTIIGGEVLDTRSTLVTFGLRKNKFSAEGSGFSYYRTKDAGAVMSYGIFNVLNGLAIAGGDVYLKRALHNTVDTLLGNITSDKTAFKTLSGNLAIASDYSRYIADPSVINALIAAEPNSAFAAGWIITLQRAEELGLNKRYASDDAGGWEYRFKTPTAFQDSLSGARIDRALAVNAEVAFDSNTHERKVQLNYERYNENGDFVKTAITKLQDGIIASSKSLLQWTDQAALNAALATVKSAAVITGTSNADVIRAGNLGNDVLGGAGDDTIYGGVLSDWIFGQDGNDSLYAYDAIANNEGIGGNNNYLDGGIGNDRLYGGDGSDWLKGGDNNDELHGAGGKDILDGGAGDDFLYGGAGSDTYIVNRGDGNTVIEDKDEFIGRNRSDLSGLSGASVWRNGDIGGGNSDVIEFGRHPITGQLIDISDLSIRLSGADLIISFNGEPAGDLITVKNWTSEFGRIEKLRFATGDEINIGDFRSFIMGTAGDDNIIGTDAKDFISGGSGDDVIDALGGDDIAIGGLGNDIVSGGLDNDLVVGSIGSDNLNGGGGSDIVSGDAGNDELRGGSGNDILSGGSGNDSINTGSGDDVVLFGRGDGHDVLKDSTSLIGVTAFQNGVLQDGFRFGLFLDTTQIGLPIFSDFGQFNPGFWYDAATQSIYYAAEETGNGLANAGDDTLEFRIGLAPADIRVKQVGNDLIIAIDDASNPEASFESLKDTITIQGWFNTDGTGRAIENFGFYTYTNLNGDGTNRVGEFNFIGGDYDTNNINDHIIGTSDKDWITAGAGNDTLSGGASRDILSGGGGNDILEGGAGADILMGGAGVDFVTYENATEGVVVDLLSGNGSANAGEAGGDEADSIEGAIGSHYADVIKGTNDSDELRGSGAVSGSDLLIGREGNDVYIFNSGDGVLNIADNDNHFNAAFEGGSDSIEFGDGIALADIHVSRVPNTFDLQIKVGTAADKIVIKDWFFSAGNQIESLLFADGQVISLEHILDFAAVTDRANVLNGSVLNGAAGNDVLLGTTGTDALTGGSGNDLFDGGAGVDVLDGGEGVDTVSYYGSTQVGQNGLVTGVVARLSQLGGVAGNADTLIGIENLEGSALDDYFEGDIHDNALAGGLGNDTLRGGAGEDVLQGGDSNDLLEGGSGEDILVGGANDDSLVGGDGADLLSGDAGNDHLESGDGYDNLLGGAGNDVLSAGSGEDILDGGAGNDVLFGGDDSDALFGGADNDSLYGESGNDLLISSDGNDWLEGGSGNDTYRIKRAAGVTTIATELVNGGASDRLELIDNIAPTDLWFTQQGDDLRIRVLNSTTEVVVKGWYSSSGSAIEIIETELWQLDKGQLQSLVNAMSALPFPSGANASIPESIQGTVAAAWLSKDTLSLNEEPDVSFSASGAFAVAENSQVGFVVGNAAASSPGNTAAIYTYSLVSADQGRFAIDAATGAISVVKSNFDFESKTQHTVTVKATNTVDPTQSFEHDYTIAVSNINEAPVIENTIFCLYEQNTFPDLNDPNWQSNLGSANGDVVGQVPRSDSEEDVLQYEILSGNDGHAFAIDNNGLITVENAQLLDYEERPFWSLQIRATDTAGFASLSTVQINLLDIGAEVTNERVTRGSSLPDNISLEGNNHDYLILGGAGGDRLRGGKGDDILEGGVGLGWGGDILNGGDGSDTYLYGRSSGYDIISNTNVDAVRVPNFSIRAVSDSSTRAEFVVLWDPWGPADPINDVIRLGADVAPADVRLYRDNYRNLRLHINGGNGDLIVDNYFTNLEKENGDAISEIQFIGGTVWNTDYIKAEVLRGYASDQYLTGFSGADTIHADAGEDTVSGGDGDDRIYGEAGYDRLYGGSGSDYLDGGSGDDLIEGGAGNDTLVGGAGNDWLEGNSLDDTYIFGRNFGSDVISDYGYGAGDSGDTIEFVDGISPGEITIIRKNTALLLELQNTDGTTSRITIANYFTGTTTSGPGAIEQIKFANGVIWDKTYISNVLSAHGVINGNDNDNNALNGSGLNDSIYGNGGNDVLNGFSGNDSLYGGNGNDVLYGGDGDDLLVGGSDQQNRLTDGNDILQGGNGNDTLLGGYGDDVFDGGAGDDLYKSRGANLVQYHDGHDTFLFGLGSGHDHIADVFDYEPYYNSEGDPNIDIIQIGAGILPADVIVERYPGDEDNDIWADDYALRLSLRGSDDELRIDGYFPDAMSDDHPSAENAVTYIIRFSNGVEWSRNDVLAMLASPADQSANGTAGNDVLYGGAGSDTLIGSAGNDVLDGRTGDDGDYLVGGTGDDRYFVDSEEDEVRELVDEGIDEILSRVSYELSDNVENGKLIDALDGRYLEGNDLNNVLTGSDGTDEIYGGNGADSVDGGTGDDYLIGGNGDDYVAGGEGNDFLGGGTGDDVLVGGDGANTYLFAEGDGRDRIESGGFDVVDTILMDGIVSTSVYLYRDGSDLVIAMVGTSDQLIVDHYFDDMPTISEIQFGDGVTWNSADIQDAVIPDIAVPLLVEGTDNDDTLVLLNGNDIVIGLGGNDILDGGIGADSLIGGLGDDVYFIDSVADTVEELVDEGHDVVRSRVDFALSDNVEELVLEGEAISGVGNSLDNYLIGNDEDNYLDGLAGADVIQGLYGNDTYVIDDANDVIYEEDGISGGRDVVLSSVSYVLEDSVEELRLTGDSAIDATGNNRDNILSGNASENILIGGAGSDTYIFEGEFGNDIINNDDEDGNISTDIVFFKDIYPNQATFNRVDDNLIITVGTNHLTVLDHFLSEGAADNDLYSIDGVRFANGNYISKADISASIVAVAQNHTPTLVVDNLTVSEDGSLTIAVSSLLANDVDVDGNTLVVTNVFNPQNGSIIYNSTAGVVKFSPNANFSGTAHFSYSVSDGITSSTGSVAINVTAVNDAPNAINATLTTNQNDTTSILLADLLSQATDIEGDLLTITGVSNSQHGNAVIDAATGAIVFTPEANYSGLASFDYTVSDGAATSRKRVTVTVLASESTPNSAPVPVSDSLVVNEDAVLTVSAASLLSNDSDADQDALTLIGVSGAQHGVVNFNATTGLVTFTPDANYHGSASFEYTVSDGVHAVTGTANVLVNSVNDLPSASPVSLQTNENAALQISLASLLTNAVDADGDSLTITAVNAASNGSVTLDLDNQVILFTPDEGFSGQASFEYTLNDGTASIIGVVNVGVIETEGMELFGTPGVDTLIGGAGPDDIYGFESADTMIGGAGSDEYWVDNIGDVVIENADEGWDLVISAIDYTLGANIERLGLSESAVVGTGNELDNQMWGNNNGNTLSGLGGNDEIVSGDGDDLLLGGDGDDHLYAGAGVDTLIGGAGSDEYSVDNIGDVVIENADEGWDAVISSIDYTLGANIERLGLSESAIVGIGNELDNQMWGNDSGNTLSGLDGNDDIVSGDGDDLLLGGDGDDHLYAGAGVDTMIGGEGSDQYSVDNIGDVVIENADEGWDAIVSSIDYTLGANIERLGLEGSALVGIGNELGNQLWAREGNNTLSGLGGNDEIFGGDGDDLLLGGEGDDNLYADAGADTMIGGEGSDQYSVDNIGDVVIENAGEGWDAIVSSIDYTLGANIERLGLEGSAIVAVGNELDNQLWGNDSNNTLSSLSGDDELWGNDGNDVLLGGDGHDYMDGGSGADVLIGGAGHDDLHGGTGSDTYHFARGDGSDRIEEYDESSNSDALIFEASIANDQLWFSRSDNDLVVSIIGTDDQVRVTGWYVYTNYNETTGVEQFKTADGKLLLGSQVENLVSAMSAFSPPTAGQTTLPQNYQSSLNSVIAANWS